MAKSLSMYQLVNLGYYKNPFFSIFVDLISVLRNFTLKRNLSFTAAAGPLPLAPLPPRESAGCWDWDLPGAWPRAVCPCDKR